MTKIFEYKFKIYYEDTDAGGVVYYANYLKFIERARSEMINSSGFSNTTLKEKFNLFFIVKYCNINYRKSAKLDDELIIFSSIVSLSKTSIVMKQDIKRGEELIASTESIWTETNLMEWEDGESIDGQTLPISLSPFEIKTWKVKIS